MDLSDALAQLSLVHASNSCHLGSKHLRCLLTALMNSEEHLLSA